MHEVGWLWDLKDGLEEVRKATTLTAGSPRAWDIAQRRDLAPKVPIVVLTALGNETLATKAVQEGAQDYLVKKQVNRHLLGCSMCNRDTVARWGATNSHSYIPEIAGAEDAAKAAWKILESLPKPFAFGVHQLHTITSIYPDNGENAQTVMKNADIAGYRARGGAWQLPALHLARWTLKP